MRRPSSVGPVVVWVVCAGCPRPDPEVHQVDPPDPPPVTTLSFPASCTVWPNNVLRVWCDATLDAAGPVRVELSPTDPPTDGSTGAARPTRTFRDDAVTTDHHVFGWGLTPGTSYDWTITDETTGAVSSGRVSTGNLPYELTGFDTQATTLSPDASFEAMAISPGCPAGFVYLVDRAGAVIWYQSIEPVSGLMGFINTMTVTSDRTFLVSTGKSTILEFDLQGNLLMRSARDEAFDNYVHHELAKRDGIVYAIYAQVEEVDGASYVLDGVYAIDGDGAVIDDLWMGDFYPVNGPFEPWMVEGYWNALFPDEVDYMHTNSVWLDDAGDLWMSMRHLHAFAKLTGGPTTPAFGALQWTLVGDPRSPIASANAYALLGDDPAFSGQHDVHLAADGTLLLLDNGLLDSERARGVRYAIDEDARTLTELDAWETGLFCPVQGGIRELPGDHVLIDCSTGGIVREYAPGAADPSWEFVGKCHDFLPAQIPRAIPFALDPPPAR